MLDQPGLLFTLLMFAALIGPLVFVHEFGHYYVGRCFGVKAEHFSIGFGPELFGWTDKRGTRWKVALLPLGGYVRFAGDMNAASTRAADMDTMPAETRAHSFIAKPLWQRALIVVAGPLANFIFAIFIYWVFILSFGHSYSPPVVHEVMSGSPAAVAGLREGDRIVAVNGRSVDRFEDIAQITSLHPGQTMEMRYLRSGAEQVARVTPERLEQVDRFGNRFTIGRIGISRPGMENVRRGPLEAVYYAGQECWLVTRAMAEGLWQVVTGLRSIKDMGGPVKIAQFSGQQASLGMGHFFALMALISINLGFINLLPIPMLDGGHLLMYGYEALVRRPMHPRVLEFAFMSGFALLIGVMVFLTWNDLASFGLFDHLSGLMG